MNRCWLDTDCFIVMYGTAIVAKLIYFFHDYNKCLCSQPNYVFWMIFIIKQFHQSLIYNSINQANECWLDTYCFIVMVTVVVKSITFPCSHTKYAYKTIKIIFMNHFDKMTQMKDELITCNFSATASFL